MYIYVLIKIMLVIYSVNLRRLNILIWIGYVNYVLIDEMVVESLLEGY